MKKLEIYDPALCCSSGVCGPSPDQELVAFAGELKTMGEQAEIQRFNLAQQPAAFASNPVVQQILNDEGPDVLPVILVDGRLAMKGVYPSKQQLEQLLGAEDSCCSAEEASTGCCEEPAPAKPDGSDSGCEGDSCC